MMVRLVNFIFVSLFVFFAAAISGSNGERPLFNGQDLSGWVNVLGAGETWAVRDGSIVATGSPRSILRSDTQYENYILELDYRQEDPAGQAGIMLHADALPAAGRPWPRGIDIRLGGKADSPAITALAAARVEPVSHAGTEGTHPQTAPPGSSTDKLWHHGRIESRDGHIAVVINGDTVSTANYASPRKGYIALKSDGSGIRFRNIRIEELPSTRPAPYEVAQAGRGFVSLYNGRDLSEHWQLKPGHRGHWTAEDWVINYDGQSEAQDKSLWTRKAFGDFVLIADMKFTRQALPDMLPVVLPSGREAKHADGRTRMVEVPYAGDTGIYVRGSSKNQINMGNRYIGSGEIYGYRVDESMPPEVRRAVTPRVKANNPLGEWNRYVITMKGDRISVELNGWRIIDDALLPGVAKEGRLALQDDHATDNRFRFGNLYIRELE